MKKSLIALLAISLISPFIGCSTKYTISQKKDLLKAEYVEGEITRFLRVEESDGTIRIYKDLTDSSPDVDFYEIITPEGEKMTYREEDDNWEEVKLQANLEFNRYLNLFGLQRDNDEYWLTKKVLRSTE